MDRNRPLLAWKNKPRACTAARWQEDEATAADGACCEQLVDGASARRGDAPLDENFGWNFGTRRLPSVCAHSTSVLNTETAFWGNVFDF